MALLRNKTKHESIVAMQMITLVIVYFYGFLIEQSDVPILEPASESDGNL